MLNLKARARKAEKIKTLGHAIHLNGKILDLQVKGNNVWTAESGAIARKVSLKVRF
jgi:hypothetical protein